MELNALQAALHEAQQGLKDVGVDFELLRIQKEKLERLITSLREVLETGTPAGSGALAKLTPPVAESHPFSITLPAAAAWAAAERVLEAAGRALSLPEIHAKIVEQGLEVAPETVRVGMFRKPGIFVRSGQGYYALKAWGFVQADKEASPEEKTS